ncbi:MAG TPA: hypothetical protein VF209_05410, partial [Patescibacteria group bacterium]
VSERTCTPVEVLIGVLAKETKGLDFNNVPATGDPNQQICRTQKCVDNVYGNGGGPYSFTLGLPPEFIGTFNSHISHAEIAPLYQECINNLSVMLSSGTMTLDARTAPQDGRIMGQSMCAFSANFWRYMSRPKLDSRLTQYPSCTGENKRSYALSEITQNNLDYFLGVHFAPGACTDPSSDFHIACLDGVRLFNLSIQLYKDDVQAVVNACRG